MRNPNRNNNRREFLQTSALLVAGASFTSLARAEKTEGAGKLFSAMGIAAPLDRAAALKAAGAEFLTENTGSFLVPDQPDEVFAKNLERLAASPLPVLACNGFIRPANLRCVGAEANHDEVLEWSEVAFRRLKQAGGKDHRFWQFGGTQVEEWLAEGKSRRAVCRPAQTHGSAREET